MLDIKDINYVDKRDGRYEQYSSGVLLYRYSRYEGYKYGKWECILENSKVVKEIGISGETIYYKLYDGDKVYSRYSEDDYRDENGQKVDFESIYDDFRRNLAEMCCNVNFVEKKIGELGVSIFHYIDDKVKNRAKGNKVVGYYKNGHKKLMYKDKKMLFY